jgi:hypothetical protein
MRRRESIDTTPRIIYSVSLLTGVQILGRDVFLEAASQVDFCAVAAAGAVVDEQEVCVPVVQHRKLGPARKSREMSGL